MMKKEVIKSELLKRTGSIYLDIKGSKVSPLLRMQIQKN